MNLKMSFSVYGVTQTLVWFRYINDVFFIWTHGEKELHKSMEDLNNHQPNIKFTYISSKNCFPFLDLDVQLSEGKQTTNLHIKPINIYNQRSPTKTIPTAPLYIVKHLEYVGSVPGNGTSVSIFQK